MLSSVRLMARSGAKKRASARAARAREPPQALRQQEERILQ